MRFSIKRFVRGLDDFGHPIRVNYKGEETFQSHIGGFLTIVVQVLTVINIVRAIKEITLMQDPQIESYKVQISVEEQMQNKSVSFAEMQYYFGVIVNVQSDAGDRSSRIPPELGELKALMRVRASKQVEKNLTLKDCWDVVPPDIIRDSDVRFQSLFERGEAQCIDSNSAQISSYRNGRGGPFTVNLELHPC